MITNWPENIVTKETADLLGTESAYGTIMTVLGSKALADLIAGRLLEIPVSYDASGSVMYLRCITPEEQVARYQEERRRRRESRDEDAP